MAQNVENIEGLKQISSVVSERDQIILENEAYLNCVTKEIERMNNEIANLEKSTEALEKEIVELETQSDQITNSINLQKETSSILQESLSIQTNGYTVLLKESKDLDHKYATLLEKYEQELMEYRSKYESTSKPFQELRAIKVEFKKLNIKKMVLEEDYKAKKFAKKQYSDIQNQILQAYIIKLAKIVVSERAAELIDMELKEEKQKEEMLLQEYRTLKSTLMLKEKTAFLNKDVIILNNIHEDVNEYEKNSKDVKKSLDIKMMENKVDTNKTDNKTLDFCEELLEDYFNEDNSPPFSITSIEKAQAKTYNQDKSKVNILDVKVFKKTQLSTPASSKPKKSSSSDLKKEMELIIKKTKQQYSRQNSQNTLNSSFQNGKLSQEVTNTSQYPQIKVSQEEKKKPGQEERMKLSQEGKTKQHIPDVENKDNISKTPILKRPLPQESAVNSEVPRKKSVTFQSEKMIDRKLHDNMPSVSSFRSFNQADGGIFDNSYVQDEQVSFRTPFNFRITENPENNQGMEKNRFSNNLKNEKDEILTEPETTGDVGTITDGSNVEMTLPEDDDDPFIKSFNCSFDPGSAPNSVFGQCFAESPRKFKGFGSKSKMFDMFPQ